MLTISLVVFVCAIVVFFSKEFGNTIKKIMSIPGMKLILPLAIVTLVIVYLEAEVLWCLTKLQLIVLVVRDKLAHLLPLQRMANYLATLLVLMSLSFLPVVAIDYWYRRKSIHGFRYINLTIVLIWLFIALLLTLVY